MKKPIHQYSLGYAAIRRSFSLVFINFYNKITVIGKSNIPTDKPVVFAINHQNALMDAIIPKN